MCIDSKNTRRNIGNTLSFMTWNIQGVKQKLQDIDFLNTIYPNDFVALEESWLDTVDDFSLAEFSYFRSDRKRSKAARRNSGGVVLLFKHKYINGLQKLKTEMNDIIWVKLDKLFFNLEKDIYICVAYLSPENSSIFKDKTNSLFEDIEKEVSKYCYDGDVIIMGDLNARTGRLKDYISDDSVNYIPLPNNYEIDNFRERLNRDNNVNSYGKKLIDLCLSTDLKIVNGRKIGDLYGNFTCHAYNGSSLVDYVIVQSKLFPKIQYLKVHSTSHLSDHCPLSFSIILQEQIEDDINTGLDPLPVNYLWETSSIEKYQEAIQSATIRSKITQYLHTNYETGNINDAVQGLNDIICNAADMSLKTCKPRLGKIKKGVKKKRGEKWYDKPCYILKREVRGMGKLLVKYPRDPYVRTRYFQLKKEYKRVIRYKRRIYKEALLSKMSEVEKSNPSQFWNTISELKADSSLPTNNDISNSISVSKWIEHFSNLNMECRNDTSLDAEIKRMESGESNSELNEEITTGEINKAIRQLKKKKSPGEDKIINEMLIYGQVALIKPIKQLFNCILKTKQFPDSWRTSIIKPIYKSGDKNNPGNYRGIALSSCLSKLFTSVINMLREIIS